MNKQYKIIENIINIAAFLIVLYYFLRFVQVIPSSIIAFIVLDYITIAFLLFDYIYRYKYAEYKKKFLKESWIELLSLIPIGFFRIFRIFRIIKKSKFMNFFKFVNTLLLSSRLYPVIIIVFLLAFLSGGIIFRVEDGVPTFFDGIWFSFVTMTTVGYGDFIPITVTGRIVSIFLMIVGVGFVSILSGGIASFLISQRRKKRKLNTSTINIDISDLTLEEKKEVQSYVDYIRDKKIKDR